MTYREALREAFVSFATSWRLLPRYGRDILDHIVNAAWAFAAGLLILVGPVLALFAPLIAFAVLKADRDEQRAIAKAAREIDEQYGHMRQKAGD